MKNSGPPALLRTEDHIKTLKLFPVVYYKG